MPSTLRLPALAALAILGVITTAPSPLAQTAAAPSIDDLINLKRVGAPAISPNGQLVAYSIRETNWDDNAYETEIWIGDAATGQSRQVGYGEKFRSLNVRNLGIGDAWDVLSGIDALVQQGIADRDLESGSGDTTVGLGALGAWGLE